MTWEYYVAAAAGLFLMACAGLLAMVVLIAIVGRKSPSVKAIADSAASVVSHAVHAAPASGIDPIDAAAKQAAWQAHVGEIQDRLTGQYKAVIMGESPPKADPGQPPRTG